MPIYEYECLKCCKKFELRRNLGDSDKNITCPACEERNVRRVFSTFAVNSPKGACAPSSPT